MQKIATALVKAQKAFGPALKTSTNPHFRSRYADLSACVEAVIDALNANGIAMIQKSYDCADGIMVAAGVGAVRVVELQKAGGRRLAATAFLAGTPVTTGTRFGA